MGLAVLPSRLKEEMRILGEKIVQGADLYADEITAKHADWAYGFMKNYDSITAENADEIIKAEIGQVFKTVLEHAGVYKMTSDGRQAFLKFIQAVNN